MFTYAYIDANEHTQVTYPYTYNGMYTQAYSSPSVRSVRGEAAA